MSWYPHSGATLGALSELVDGYSRTSGALHFTVERPITDELFLALLHTRAQEFAG